MSVAISTARVSLPLREKQSTCATDIAQVGNSQTAKLCNYVSLMTSLTAIDGILNMYPYRIHVHARSAGRWPSLTFTTTTTAASICPNATNDFFCSRHRTEAGNLPLPKSRPNSPHLLVVKPISPLSGGFEHVLYSPSASRQQVTLCLRNLTTEIYWKSNKRNERRTPFYGSIRLAIYYRMTNSRIREE